MDFVSSSSVSILNVKVFRHLHVHRNFRPNINSKQERDEFANFMFWLWFLSVCYMAFSYFFIFTFYLYFYFITLTPYIRTLFMFFFFVLLFTPTKECWLVFNPFFFPLSLSFFHVTGSWRRRIVLTRPPFKLSISVFILMMAWKPNIW